MSLVLSGTDGVSDIDGSAATPAIRGTDTNTGIFFPAADTIAFAEGGVESARLDSSGNLGLGVTPSASSVASVMMQMKGGAVYSSNSTNMMLLGNAFYNGTNWIYQNNGFAEQYIQGGGSGQHQWYVAPSGTAGNAISFTQAMTLDASGNLLVNRTSAQGTTPSRIQTVGSGTLSSTTVTRANTAGIYLTDSTNTANNGVGVWFDHGALMAGIASSRVTTGNWGTDLRFYTHSDTTSGLDETYERARIDSSGNLLVGTTSSVGRLTVNRTSGNWAASFQGANAAGCILIGNQSGTTTYDAVVFTHSGFGTQTGSITVTSSGTTTYNTSSDYRLKDNIAPMTDALAKVAALKPCTYTWKSNGSVGQGFIAHELAEVVPDCVSGEKDAVDAEGKPQYQGIDTSFLVATLTAAIQEQQDLINAQQAALQTLTARVTALEGTQP
jgi:hypothetical protein